MIVAKVIERLKQLTVKSHDNWSFNPNVQFWDNQVNTHEMEELSGVNKKVELIKRLGATHIIGGIETGGNDEIFLHDEGLVNLNRTLDGIPTGDLIFLYCPHPFWSNIFSIYKWIPSWRDVYSSLISKPDWDIYQYSPTFDSAGRYFFVAKKTPRKKELSSIVSISRKSFHVFYYREGGDITLSRSNMALSAHLCLALTRVGATVYAHDMNDTNAVSDIDADDILIGHVGQWVKAAHNHGLSNIILFNPANQWHPTRNSEYFEKNATIAEQVQLAKMVIAQSGSIWRLTANVIDPQKWRWIDLGVDPQLFPFIKKKFNPMGDRKFLFFHLYDEIQKGADIASDIIRARDTYQFTWIGGKVDRFSNVQKYPFMENTSAKFRKLMKECDFVLIPSREDAQPGSFIEAASIGLIPVASYTSGYSVSFPAIIDPNNPEKWLEALDILQNLEDEILLSVQAFFQYYLRAIHNWTEIENLILFYLRECL